MRGTPIAAGCVEFHRAQTSPACVAADGVNSRTLSGIPSRLRQVPTRKRPRRRTVLDGHRFDRFDDHAHQPDSAGPSNASTPQPPSSHVRTPLVEIFRYSSTTCVASIVVIVLLVTLALLLRQLLADDPTPPSSCSPRCANARRVGRNLQKAIRPRVRGTRSPLNLAVTHPLKDARVVKLHRLAHQICPRAAPDRECPWRDARSRYETQAAVTPRGSQWRDHSKSQR